MVFDCYIWIEIISFDFWLDFETVLPSICRTLAVLPLLLCCCHTLSWLILGLFETHWLPACIEGWWIVFVFCCCFRHCWGNYWSSINFLSLRDSCSFSWPTVPLWIAGDYYFCWLLFLLFFPLFFWRDCWRILFWVLHTILFSYWLELVWICFKLFSLVLLFLVAVFFRLRYVWDSVWYNLHSTRWLAAYDCKIWFWCLLQSHQGVGASRLTLSQNMRIIIFNLN